MKAEQNTPQDLNWQTNLRRRPIGDKTILVIGKGTPVAEEIEAQIWPMKYKIVCLDRQEAGLLDIDKLRQEIDRLAPVLVINTSGFRSVEKAESEKVFATAHNHWAMADLAEVAGARDLPLIHLSSDQVFSGAKPGPYNEDDAPDAVTVLGQSQAAGEAEIRAQCRRHVIVRTSQPFGVRGHNPLRTILALGRGGGKLHVPCDETSGPTPMRELASALRHMALRLLDGAETYGTVHYCGKPASTWMDVAREAFHLAAAYQPEPELIPMPPERFGLVGAGPRRVELDCSRIEKLFGLRQPDWKVALVGCIEEIFAHEARGKTVRDGKTGAVKTVAPVRQTGVDRYFHVRAWADEMNAQRLKAFSR